MNSTLKFLWIALAGLFILGVVSFSVWKVPAPSIEIRKEIKLKRPLQ